MSTDLIRRLVLAASAGCYVLALCLPATDGPQGAGTVYGITCLIAPVAACNPLLFFFFFFGGVAWLANPAYALALVFLWRRWPFLAVVQSAVALAVASSFLVYCATQPGFPMFVGSWFWFAAMAVLGGGSVVTIISAATDAGPQWVGRWSGAGQPAGLHVAEVEIGEERVPCAGRVVTQFGTGAMAVTAITWDVVGGVMVGTPDAAAGRPGGVTVQKVTVRRPRNTLSGTVSAVTENGDVVELEFKRFERSG